MSTLGMFADWLGTIPGAADYQLARGSFVEATGLANTRFAVVQQNGGRAPIQRIEFPHVRLVLLGVRDGRNVAGEVVRIETFAQQVFDFAEENPEHACVMQINQLGSIMGPYYTAENRPWYSLNFELII